MADPAAIRLPHVDSSGRGLDDGDCIHCGDSGNLGSTECHVRLRQALDAAERQRDALRAWVREALPYIESEAQGSTGYGYYRPANPHHFSPDAECCTVAELEAHAAACEAYDRGEAVDSGGCETATTPDGEVVAHILRAPWGIGSYQIGDEDAVRIRDEGRALLGEEDDDAR